MRVRRKKAAASRIAKPLRLAAKVSVVIPVMNERKTLALVVREAMKLTVPAPEVVLVVNGSTDGSDRIADTLGVKVVRFAEPLGHDVGRSVGARHATGDIVLFMDADMRIPASQLRPFLASVYRGVDLALNRYRGVVRRRHVHPVVLAKHALCAALARYDLCGASLTAVPHALSRRALDTIGAEALCVPPVALAVASLAGLSISTVGPVQVSRLNPVRRRSRTGVDPLAGIIVGDHIEALGRYTNSTNDRGGFTDLARNRNIVR